MRRRAQRLSAAAVLLLGAGAGAVPASDLASGERIEEPRAFGHVIGDSLERHIDIDVPAAYRWAGVPASYPGRVSPWLELESVDVVRREAGRVAHYRVALKYLIINSPLEPTLAALPSMTLRFAAADMTFSHPVEEWPVVIAPLAVGAVRAGLPAWRPARPPTLIDAAPIERRLGIEALAVAVVAAASVVRAWGVTRRARRGAFAGALRQVRRLASPSIRPEAPVYRECLRVIHRAFDVTAGRPLFAAQVADFLRDHPHFHGLEAEVRAFFAHSRQEFFGSEPKSPRLDGVVRFVARMAVAERSRAAPNSRGVNAPAV